MSIVICCGCYRPDKDALKIEIEYYPNFLLKVVWKNRSDNSKTHSFYELNKANKNMYCHNRQNGI